MVGQASKTRDKGFLNWFLQAKNVEEESYKEVSTLISEDCSGQEGLAGGWKSKN